MPRMICDGWWEQAGLGRQPMPGLVIDFEDGEIRGEGKDMVGPFTLRGQLHENRILIHKQYIGRHAIQYSGTGDGEGVFFGDWSFGGQVGGQWSIRFRTLHPSHRADDLSGIPRIDPS